MTDDTTPAPNPTLTRRAVIAGVGLIGASVAAQALKPQPRLDHPWGTATLASMVPTAFAGWREQAAAMTGIVNPQLEQLIATIYSDLLTRSYVNASGEVMMLSLAYGRNQNRDLQVHKPEVCYVAQGFQLKAMRKATVHSQRGELPAMQLVAQAGQRNEPITYWIRVGDQVIRGWLEQNVARIQQGIKGYLPDGLLVRVSSISADNDQAFTHQAVFLSDMLSAIDPRYLPMFIGGPVR